jgi:ferredoxin
MTQHRVAVSKTKCQSFGRCVKLLPGTFGLDENRKVELLNIEGVAGEQLVRTAKGCPYRAITVTDGETGEQIFPPLRK